MSQEKFVKHYSEILNSTLNEQIMRNISMQANAKLAEEIMQEQGKKIDELVKANGQLGQALQEAQNSLVDLQNTKSTNTDAMKNLQNRISEQQSTINRLNSENNNLIRLRNEYESLKSQASNVDTFRNELIKERDSHQQTRMELESKIDELTAQIATLQAPPKRKKTKKDAEVTQTEEVQMLTFAESDEPDTMTEQIVRDGGSF
jgi:chromosome segregation ATPase